MGTYSSSSFSVVVAELRSLAEGDRPLEVVSALVEKVRRAGGLLVWQEHLLNYYAQLVRGDEGGAWREWERAYVAARDANEKSWAADIAVALGRRECDGGVAEQAIGWYERGAELYAELGKVRQELSARVSAAEVMMSGGDVERGVVVLQEVVDRARIYGYSDSEVEAREALLYHFHQSGRLAEFFREAEEVRKLIAAGGDAQRLIEFYLRTIPPLNAASNVVTALEYLRQASELIGSADVSPAVRSRFAYADAVVRSASVDEAQQHELWETVLAAAERADISAYRCAAWCALLEIEAKRQNREEVQRYAVLLRRELRSTEYRRWHENALLDARTYTEDARMYDLADAFFSDLIEKTGSPADWDAAKMAESPKVVFAFLQTYIRRGDAASLAAAGAVADIFADSYLERHSRAGRHYYTAQVFAGRGHHVQAYEQMKLYGDLIVEHLLDTGRSTTQSQLAYFEVERERQQRRQAEQRQRELTDKLQATKNVLGQRELLLSKLKDMLQREYVSSDEIAEEAFRSIVESMGAASGEFIEQAAVGVAMGDFQNRLLRDFPALTTRDLRYCCLIVHGYSIKELALYFATTEDSVKQVRKRLRKKLSAPTASGLQAFLSQYYAG